MVRRRRLVVAAVLAAVLLLLLTSIAAFQLLPTEVDSTVDRTPGVALDTDGDGIVDRVESAGWRMETGFTYRTDPKDADTDGDGLSDSEEAGPRVDGVGDEITYLGISDPTNVDSDGDGLTDAVELGDLTARAGPPRVAYAVADPLVIDTDSDGIGDGNEYFLDMDPLLSDTDSDGLLDLDEMDFGSDPTLVNADDDSYADAEEFERGSNPLSYDLNGDEQIAAAEAGLKYGDCVECALDAGLILEQVESAEYLGGHFVSGVAVYGDVRDLALNLWKREFAAAGLAAIGVLPVVGDHAKAVALLTEFARRGDRAEQAVRVVTDKLPLPQTVKAKILAALPSRVGRLPVELAGGPQTYVVYQGAGAKYIGITRDFARREAEHAKAGRSFTPYLVPGLSGLSLGEARSIEEACISQGLRSVGGLLENKIHSINPSHDYHPAAVAWGLARLAEAGAGCP